MPPVFQPAVVFIVLHHPKRIGNSRLTEPISIPCFSAISRAFSESHSNIGSSSIPYFSPKVKLDMTINVRGRGRRLRCFHADLLLAHNITLFAELGKHVALCRLYPGIVVIKKGRPAGILKRMPARAAQCARCSVVGLAATPGDSGDRHHMR